MAYSASLRQAVGCVRRALSAMGVGVQDERFLRHGEHTVETDAPLVLIACSGGRDSLALAAVSHIVCDSLGVRCGAVIVDHQLQDDSHAVSAQAAARCVAVGLEPVTIRTVRVDDPHGKGVEASAREARYGALVQASEQLHAAAVLLAHTKNDQAETILMALLRSGGVDALAGMPERFELGGVAFARPFLDVTRKQTTTICEDLQIPWWDDPTNADRVDAAGMLPKSYPLRSRVRHDLVPYLERFTGSDIVAHITASTQARSDKEYLDEQADRLADQSVSVTNDSCVQFDVKRLAEAPQSLRSRVFAHTLSSMNIEISAVQIAAMDRLVVDWHGQGVVALPSGYSASRQKHVIRVCQDGGHANC